MKKYIFLLSMAAFGYIFSNMHTPSFATDTSGCLTCHKFPGLVRTEKPHKYKVLHIDREKHLNSPHGKVACRECHPNVNKIPHTGETAVDCTTKCHHEDKEKILAIKYPLNTIHKEEGFFITHLEDRSSCKVCHFLYPHSADKKVRALLNVHTGYLVCEMCHLKKENLKNISYEWKSPETVEFSGEPYGKFETRKVQKTEKTRGAVSRFFKSYFSRKDQQEETAKIKYLKSRIAAFSEEKGKKRLLVNTKDINRAIAFKAGEKNLPPEEKERQLKYFHKDIARKKISVACDECHSTKSILDFEKLGFNEKRTKDLKYMNLKSLIKKYDIFYLPNLFGQ